MLEGLFYRNRRLLILLMALIAVAGLSSFYILPRMEDPVLTKRSALVQTRFPGADATRVESLVSERIEEELREIDEIKELRSISRSGMSTITIELRDDVYEVDEVWSRIRDKIDDARVEFPSGAKEPDFEEMDVKAYALIVALVWDNPNPVNYAVLRRSAKQLEDRLRAVSGTEDIDTFGDPDEEILVEIQPDRVATLGLSVEQIAQQVEASDAKLTAGLLRGQKSDLLIDVDSELDSLARIARTPVQFGSEGHSVQLGDIATIHKGVAQPLSSLVVADGKPAVTLGMFVRDSMRIDHWSQEAKNVIREFEQSLADDVQVQMLFDQNRYVEARLSGLIWNLLFGGLAVIVVIVFMMGWRNALVIGTALPLSAFMVLAGLRMLDIPIHQMSVTGLIIALGLLIDNAIVVVDEVRSKLHARMAPEDAVISTVRHLAVPLLGSTLTTALAFAPIALMPGPAGEFVGSIAISVILAICSSFFLAMTVIPAIAALFADPEEDPETGHWWQVGFSHAGLRNAYSKSLDFLFSKPLLGVGLGCILPISGFIVAGSLPEQFFPPADRDQINIELELSAHASLAETRETIAAIREVVLEHPQVRGIEWFLGESAPQFYYNIIAKRENSSNFAQALVQLNSAHGGRQLIHELQQELDRKVPHSRVLVRQLEQGPPFDAPIEVRLFGPDLHQLSQSGDELRSILSKTPDVLHHKAELADPLPKLTLKIDEEQARLAGLDHAEISRQLNAALEGTLGGSILEETEELPVRIRVPHDRRGSLENIASLQLISSKKTPDGQAQYVPLTAIADVKMSSEIAAISHFNGERMNEVQAYIKAGVLPAKVLADFQKRLQQAGYELPPGYRLEWGGEASKRDDAVGNLMANVGVLMVLMVATLVLSFSSFRVAGLVGAVGILSIGLGLGMLWLFGFPFGFMAIVGSMGLAGVAINDAIVVLAELRANPQARKGDRVVVRDVVLRSTRHVVATSLTTVAGFIPLVLAGGGFWPPLAITIAGGVGGATLLALYFIPSAYILVMCRNCPLRAGAEDPVPEGEGSTLLSKLKDRLPALR
ncbi:Cobalt-zinc-cadmium resistance protein CzcA [Gimesia chilikensis]|uniref:Cobalt-zinc-cadmium resistance protein CzcA n=1 Tax=Gimesia chilikensis TaxID=2605989 RepID=A0A517WEG2_9PLAN|nr:efflux RND transporter permease subunit [Gimesia chilikensis]QDU03638.1 Cobalt-zinc-cadmium resistance protein CzcA [Gimesia chilikensis]